MKRSISKIASAVRASTTLAIDAMYKKMKAEGEDVIGFGAGEPDFPTPDLIKEAGIAAIQNNQTKYTPVAGTEAVRKAVCARLLEDCGLSYEPSQILVSPGAKYNLYLALICLLNPGDEVILPAPYWVSYYEMIRMAGGIPVIVETTEESGLKITADMLKNAITDKTKALILNNPSNPTGMVYSREELTALGRVCVETGVYVISDEIYYKLVYGNVKFVSFPSICDEFKDLTILINGVSKTYAMTGWRIGFAAAPSEIAKVMANYQSHSTSNPCSISQEAARAAMTGPQDCVEAMRKEFEKRRDFIYTRIGGMERVSCLRPDGAFYIMMNLSRLMGTTMYGEKVETSDDFARLLLNLGKVAVVPCTGFGAPNYVRLSYASAMKDISAGLDRIEAFIQNA